VLDEIVRVKSFSLNLEVSRSCSLPWILVTILVLSMEQRAWSSCQVTTSLKAKVSNVVGLGINTLNRESLVV